MSGRTVNPKFSGGGQDGKARSASVFGVPAEGAGSITLSGGDGVPDGPEGDSAGELLPASASSVGGSGAPGAPGAPGGLRPFGGGSVRELSLSGGDTDAAPVRSEPVVRPRLSAQEDVVVEGGDVAGALSVDGDSEVSVPAPRLSVTSKRPAPVSSFPSEVDVLPSGVPESGVAGTSEVSSGTPVEEVLALVKRPKAVNPLFADPVVEKVPAPAVLRPRPAAPVVERPALPVDSVSDGVGETVVGEPKRVMSERFTFKPAPVKKVERTVDQSSPDALVDVGGVEEFDEPVVREKKVRKPRRSFQLTERDIVLIRFLVRYQYSYVDALARLVDTTPQAIMSRLRVLEEYDLVKRQRIAAGATLWSARKAGIELVGLNFVESKRDISFATIQHTIGLVNIAAELEREAGGKDVLGLKSGGFDFPVRNRFPSGIRVYSPEDLARVDWQFGEMTVSEREIRQGQKRWRGGQSTREMRELVELAIANPDSPELEEGNEGLFVVYGQGGKTGEHVPDLVVTRPRHEDGRPGHFAIELELTAKSPSDWKRILRSFRDSGGMYEKVYYFTDKRPIANMIRNADSEVGLGDRLVVRKYTPKNPRQPFLG